MDKLTLAHLEQAIEPYRRAGFVVTSQSESAITLALPPERFSYLLFIILLLVWPLAVLYLVSYNLQREKSVCLRFTSQGYIEVSGYTLEDIARERRRRKFTYRLVLAVIAIIILLILLLAYLSRM
jgi:ABC-type spermidine/putrescine transport system permease subunit II